MAAVLCFKRGRPCLQGRGEAGSYASAALQEGSTTGGSRAWDLEAMTHWILLEWLLSLSSPPKACSHSFSFLAAGSDHCLSCLRHISHCGLVMLLHHHLLELMPCTPEKLSTRVTRNGDYTYAQTSKLKQFLHCPISTLQKHMWVLSTFVESALPNKKW